MHVRIVLGIVVMLHSVVVLYVVHYYHYTTCTTYVATHVQYLGSPTSDESSCHGYKVQFYSWRKLPEPGFQPELHCHELQKPMLYPLDHGDLYHYIHL